MHDKRAQTARPGSESGANVQEAVRERVRAHCLWGQTSSTAGMREGLYFWKKNRWGKDADTQEFWDSMHTKQQRTAEAAEKHA